MFKKLIIIIKKSIKFLYYVPSIKKNHNITSFLKNDLFTLVDIGATGGIDGHWTEIKDFCHYITFDPDPRAQIINQCAKHTNYQTALWSKNKKNMNFYLTNYQSASTLFELNKDLLSKFLNSSCHRQIKTTKINVNKLENIIEKSIDFIKIDAEGADLEILKGSEKYLKNSILGIEIEVSFINRHINSPYFSDIDSYLRKQGFTIMDLHIEKWIRNNNCFKTTSRPQMVWGNAIYVLSKENLLKKIQLLSKDNRNNLFIKYVIILMIYNFHDYAIEICDFLKKENIISSFTYRYMKNLIIRSLPSKTLHILKLIFALVISFIPLVFFCFSTNLRKKSLTFFKERLKDLAKCIINTTRYGTNNCCISN